MNALIHSLQPHVNLTALSLDPCWLPLSQLTILYSGAMVSLKSHNQERMTAVRGPRPREMKKAAEGGAVNSSVLNERYHQKHPNLKGPAL